MNGGSGHQSPNRLTSVLVRMLADERVRFVLVGGFNTIVGYGLFVLLELTIGSSTSYLVSLYVSYAVGTVIAFATHRTFTFQISGRRSILLDFLRFQGVNLVSLAFNSIALPLLVEVVHLNPIVAQAIIVIFTTTISYVGHKFFSFRRAKKDPDTRENSSPILPGP